MTDDNSNSEIVDIPEDFPSFREAFLNPDKAPEAEAAEEDTEDDALATDDDTDAPDGDEDLDADEAEDDGDDEGDDESESDDEDQEDPEEKPEPKKGKGKKSAQQRINEITRRARESERREAALIQRLEALEARERTVSKEEPLAEKLPQGAPDPDAEDANGVRKYPLGELDPQYMIDITKFTVEQEFKTRMEQSTREAEAKRIAEEQAALSQQWSEKVAKAEEEIPELREHIEDLVDAFSNLEPAYGEYLATTIMTSENGPSIMEYLSQNIGEAQQIVRSGPAAATLAIGRLDARLSKPVTTRPNEVEKRKKITSASEPPKVNKGRKGQSTVREDTTDLAAFKRDFGF